MMTKLIKSALILTVALTFFGGAAMADGHGHHKRHHSKWEHGQGYHKKHHGHRHYVQHVYRVEHYNPPRPAYHPPRHISSQPHPLAPRIAFLGPLPVPVPPPPNEVIDYISGRR